MQSNVEQQYQLGLKYYTGNGLPHDFVKAVEYWTAASNQGHADAQCGLGLCYENGQGVIKDAKRAAELYQLAADQGHAEAQCGLGLCYENGQGVAKDKKRAIELFQLAADQGYAEAQYYLGVYYINGQGVAKDEKRAAEFFQLAANQGYAEALCYLGVCYQNGQGVAKDEKRAAGLFQSAANQGYAQAQCNLGICYANGQGVSKDEKRAAEFFQSAANQKHPKAQCLLGFYYLNGHGVAKDEKRAVEFFQLAASQGHVQAQYNLGICYENGQGLAKDVGRAAELYQLAANQWHAGAQNNLGICYENGHGVSKDEKRAAELYQLAANQGHSDAKENLKRLLQANPSLVTSQQTSDKFAAGIKTPTEQTLALVSQNNKKEKSDIIVNDSYKIDYSSISLGKKLGQGGFGIVYQGIRYHEEVAVKQLLIDNLSEDSLEEFQAEVQAMTKLRSRYIVQFYGYCLSPKYSIVMEYMPKGALFSLLRSKTPLDWNIRIRMATEIAFGLAILHSENILHGDIKSLNVLLDEQLHVKLTDFGLSKIKNEIRILTKNAVGSTPQWMAPETLKLKPVYSKKSDIYSLGMTFWEVAARQIPYEGADPSVIKDAVQKGEREDIPADCPKKLATLIKACWEGDPLKRPDSDTVVQFLKSDQEDFVAFLPGYISKKTAADSSAAFVSNSNSSSNAVNQSGSATAKTTSFDAALVSNLNSASNSAKQNASGATKFKI